MMLLLGGVTAGDIDYPLDKLGPDPVYNDTWDYSRAITGYARCGDKCIFEDADCHCGSDIFRPWVTEEHFCITSEDSCNKEPGWRGDGDGVCSKGRKLSMSSHCNNSDRSLQCHNSYQFFQEGAALLCWDWLMLHLRCRWKIKYTLNLLKMIFMNCQAQGPTQGQC